MRNKLSFPGRAIRNTWKMNPITRIHENDPRKNRKKVRQSSRQTVTEAIRRYKQDNGDD